MTRPNKLCTLQRWINRITRVKRSIKFTHCWSQSSSSSRWPLDWEPNHFEVSSYTTRDIPYALMTRWTFPNQLRKEIYQFRTKVGTSVWLDQVNSAPSEYGSIRLQESTKAENLLIAKVNLPLPSDDFSKGNSTTLKFPAKHQGISDKEMKVINLSHKWACKLLSLGP